MHNRASSSARAGRGTRGASLVELLVVMVILSVLAVLALPVAETALQRQKETDLRETLRVTRGGIDRFHEDWRDGLLSEGADTASERGYPVRLEVLVDGVTDDTGAVRRYLRGLPRNPFAPREADLQEQWVILGHDDDPEADRWGGVDVFDLRPRTDKEALDGSAIAEW